MSNKAILGALLAASESFADDSIHHMTNTSTPTTAEVLDLFDAALKLASAEATWDSEEEVAAQNAAFEAAAAAGWNYEDDEQFSQWCLKATSEEILAEGKVRFQKAFENSIAINVQAPAFAEGAEYGKMRAYVATNKNGTTKRWLLSVEQAPTCEAAHKWLRDTWGQPVVGVRDRVTPAERDQFEEDVFQMTQAIRRSVEVLS